MRRNTIAKDLGTPKYRQRKVRNAKRYVRKEKHAGRRHEA